MLDLSLWKTAVQYSRLSAVHGDTEETTERHELACQVWLDREGVYVAPEHLYRDIGISAAQRKKPRLDYERMMAGVRLGDLPPHIVCYKIDRLWRRKSEGEAFLEDWEEDFPHFAITAVADGISYASPLNEDQWEMHLRMISDRIRDAAQEVRNTRQRVKDKNKYRSTTGQWQGGPRAFGYTAKGRQVLEEEAALIRQAAKDILESGLPVRTIATRWNAAGYRTPERGQKKGIALGGRPFRGAYVLQIMTSPRIAGLRQHKGEIIGTAAWKPIIDQETHKKLVAALPRQQRIEKGRPAVHLLSGILSCGQPGCGRPLYSIGKEAGRNKRRYTCLPSDLLGCNGVAIGASPTDDYVTEMCLAAVESGEFQHSIRAALDGTEEGALLAEVAELEGELADLAEQVAARKISTRQMVIASEGLQEHLRKAQQQLERMATTSSFLAAVPAPERVRAQWEREPLEWRRGMIRTVTERIVVLPDSGVQAWRDGRRIVNVPGRVRILWR